MRAAGALLADRLSGASTMRYFDVPRSWTGKIDPHGNRLNVV
jgi:hypothetical protein